MDSRWLALFLVALGMSACSSSSAGAASPSPSPTPPTVRAARVVRGRVAPALIIPGAIAPQQTVALSNALSEPAAAVTVREGDRVRIGELLAQLNVDDLQASLQAALRTAHADEARAQEAAFTAQQMYASTPSQVAQARAALLAAQQTTQEADRNLDRDSTLTAQGYLSQQSTDEQRIVVRNDIQAETQAQAQLTEAFATRQANGSPQSGLQASTVEAARADAAAQEATAQQLQHEIERAHITSPVDGIVVNRNLNPGEYPAGRQIFTLEANDVVYAILTASAVQAYAIQNGDPVGVTIPGVPGVQRRGHVEALLDAATAGSTNFVVKVAIPNHDGRLRAGTPVQGAISLHPTSGLVIPTSAFTNDARTRVITIVAARARSRNVREIATDGTSSVVSGLQSGEMVVRDGASGLIDNQPIAVTR